MHTHHLVPYVGAVFGANVNADRFGPDGWIALAIGIVMFAIVVGFMVLTAYEMITNRHRRRQERSTTTEASSPQIDPGPEPGSNTTP